MRDLEPRLLGPGTVLCDCGSVKVCAPCGDLLSSPVSCMCNATRSSEDRTRSNSLLYWTFMCLWGRRFALRLLRPSTSYS